MNSVFLTAIVLLLAAQYTVNGCPYDCEKNVVSIEDDPTCVCHFLKCYGQCGTTDIESIQKPCWKSCVRACAANPACKAAVYTADGTCKLKGAACKRCGTGSDTLTHRGNRAYQYYEKIGECGDRENNCVSQGGECRPSSVCAAHTAVLNAHCPQGQSCCTLKTCVDVGGTCHSSQCTPTTREIAGTCGANQVCCKTPECFSSANNGFCHPTRCAGNGTPKTIPVGGNVPGRKGCGPNEFCCKCQESGKYHVWDSALNSFKCIGEDESSCKTRRDITGFCVNINGCINPYKGIDKGKENCPGATTCCHCPTSVSGNTQWYAIGNNIRGGFCDINDHQCTTQGGSCERNTAQCTTNNIGAAGICPRHAPVCCLPAAAPSP